jgi:hypothetical protein
MVQVCRILIGLFLLAMASSTLHVYPHQLAYFNELAGGPTNGYEHLLGSNFDWGQDWVYVKDWLNSQPTLGKQLYLQKTAMYDPADFGIRGSCNWDDLSARSLPKLFVVGARDLQRRGLLSKVRGAPLSADDLLSNELENAMIVRRIGVSIYVLSPKDGSSRESRKLQRFPKTVDR